MGFLDPWCSVFSYQACVYLGMLNTAVRYAQSEERGEQGDKRALSQKVLLHIPAYF